jgi:GAF domain-containing protein
LRQKWQFLDKRFPSLVEPENLSWLGIPLLAKSELRGVLALEKKEANFYTPEQIQAVTTFASQAAVALENARLFEESVRRTAELDQRTRRLTLLNELSGELGGSLDVDHIVRLVSLRLLTALSVDRVSVVLTDEQAGQYSWAFEEPAFEENSESLPAFPLLERLRESKGVYNCADVQADAELAILQEQYFKPRGVQSLLIVPLLSGANLLGWVWLQATIPHRYNPQEIELACTICNQAAIAIQNARLFAETRSLSEELEKRVEERTAELRREHRNTEMLLRVITELSASLDIDQVLNRSLEVLNEATGSEQALVILSHGGEREIGRAHV